MSHVAVHRRSASLPERLYTPPACRLRSIAETSRAHWTSANALLTVLGVHAKHRPLSCPMWAGPLNAGESCPRFQRMLLVIWMVHAPQSQSQMASCCHAGCCCMQAEYLSAAVCLNQHEAGRHELHASSMLVHCTLRLYSQMQRFSSLQKVQGKSDYPSRSMA